MDRPPIRNGPENQRSGIFFRNSQKFAQFRSKIRSIIRSNHWVPSSTVQLRKYVEREFKMRLMIALIKFSRVKFEILKFLANFNF